MLNNGFACPVESVFHVNVFSSNGTVMTLSSLFSASACFIIAFITNSPIFLLQRLHFCVRMLMCIVRPLQIFHHLITVNAYHGIVLHLRCLWVNYQMEIFLFLSDSIRNEHRRRMCQQRSNESDRERKIAI